MMKEIREKLITIAGKCAVGNVMFPAMAGTSYTAQEIIAGHVGVESLKRMYKTAKRKLSSLQEEDDIFSTQTKSKVGNLSNLLKSQIEFIETYMAYTNAKAEIAAKVKETKEQNARIKDLIAKKKDESLASLSIEDLEKLLEE